MYLNVLEVFWYVDERRREKTENYLRTGQGWFSIELKFPKDLWKCAVKQRENCPQCHRFQHTAGPTTKTNASALRGGQIVLQGSNSWHEPERVHMIRIVCLASYMGFSPNCRCGVYQTCGACVARQRRQNTGASPCVVPQYGSRPRLPSENRYISLSQDEPNRDEPAWCVAFVGTGKREDAVKQQACLPGNSVRCVPHNTSFDEGP